MINNYLQITSRYLKTQKRRTFMTIIGIVLSSALIAAVGTLAISMWQKMYEETMKNEGSFEVTILSASKDKAENIKNHVSISEAGTVVELGTGGKNLVDNDKNILTDAKEFDPEGYKICAYDKKAFEMWPIILESGRLPEASDEIIIGNETLPYLKKKINIGDKISIDNSDGTEEKQYMVVGFLDSNLNFARRMEGITFCDDNLTSQNAKYRTYVKFKNKNNIYEATKELLNDLGNDNGNAFKISYNQKVLQFLLQNSNSAYNSALISGCAFLGIIIVLAMSAVIYNIFNMAILERVSQFGLLRCIGATKKQVRKLVFKEATILGVIGIPLGIILGTLAIKILLMILKVIVPNLPFGQLTLIISPYIIIISFVLSLISIYISAFGPARKAEKISPLEAIRNTGSFKMEKFHSIAQGEFIKKIFGAEGWIARKNLGRNRKRFYITVFSMVISIVLLIIFSGIIDLTYKTGVNDSDNEFFQFQISHKDNRGDVKLTEEDYTNLSSFEGIDKIYKYYYRYFDAKQGDAAGDEVLVPNNLVNPKLKDFNLAWYNEKSIYKGYIDFDKSQIVGLSKENLAVLNKYLLKGEISPEKMNSEHGIIIVNTGENFNPKTNKHMITDSLNIKLGDKIRIRIPKTDQDNIGNSIDEYKEYTVQGILKQGIWGQKFNINGGINVFTTEDIYRELTKKDRNPDYLAIKLKDNADVTKVRSYLNSMMKNYPDFLLRDRQAEMEENKQYSIVISIFVYGFLSVIAAISCVNIFNTIGTNITLRTRELSILKAIGMSKHEINKLIRFECIFYAITAIVIGDIIGIVGSSMLYRMFRAAIEIQWNIPWLPIIIASIGTAIATLLASYLPLKRISNTVIVEGINNEE